MKIVLINPPSKQHIARDMAGGLGFNAGPEVILPPLDFCIYATTLKKAGHRVTIIDSQVISSKNLVLEKIKDFDPDRIIVNVSLPTLKNDCLFIKVLQEKGFKTVARTTLTYKEILKQILDLSEAKYCIFGECDLNIDKILSDQCIDNVAFLRDREIKLGPKNIPQNLDEIPWAVYELIEVVKYRYPLLPEGPVLTMQTSRGCPFACAYYCPYPLVQGQIPRAMSPPRIFDELKYIVGGLGIKNILFRDATFTLDKKRVTELCKLIKDNNLKFNWWCETRINCLNEELMLIMKEAGCQGMNIGVETGDPLIMESQAKLGVTFDQFKKINEVADKLGLKLHFLLLIGLPQETKKSLYKTFQLIKDYKPKSMGVTIITPYPGTPLFDEALKNKWIETFDWSRYSGNITSMHTDHLSRFNLWLAQKMLQLSHWLNCKARENKGWKIILELESLFFQLWSAIEIKRRYF